MKLCIFGSRELHPSIEDIDAAIAELMRDWRSLAPPVTQVISGGARGADAAGERWAAARNVPLVVMPADWNAWGARAGSIRNGQMALTCEAAVGFWNGHSRGTQDMVGKLRDLHRPFVLRIVR